MKKSGAFLRTCLVVLLFSPIGTGQETAGKAAAEATAWFAPWARDNSPGACVLVVRDGRILLNQGFGLADLETRTPLGPDTAMLLASVSKQFTAMAIMILAERGKLSYDDTLASFFPGFPAYARAITVRHLLHHTSGLPDYEGLFVKTGKISAHWPRSIQEAPEKYEPTAADALRLLEQQPELLFQPGAKWEYSNSGYMVLGQIIEKASGMRYRDFLRDAIFRPLGMTATAVYDETKPVIPNRATSYSRESGKFQNVDYTPLNGIYGEDNVVSTLNDLVRWDQALYTEKLAKQATLKEAFAPGRLDDGTTTGYGYGWSVGTRLGLPYVEHGGSWLGFRNFILRYPREHFAVVVLSNLAEFDSTAMANKVARIFLREQMTFPVAKTVAPETLRDYVGRYELGSQLAAEVTMDGGQLWIRLPRGERTPLRAETERRFFFEGQEHITVEFNQGAGGKVVSLTLPGGRRTAPKTRQDR